MEESISKLNSTILKTIENCPWIQSQKYKDLIKCIQDELNEVVEALDKKNNDNLEEEIGDLLFTVILLGLVSEKDKKISFVNSINRINEKIIKRSPHVFGDKKATTSKEALELWNSVKNKDHQI